MIRKYNKALMPMNMVDGVDFTANDHCVWIMHTPGACGDLIASIINCHYINTGCDYFGIDDNGQVMFLPADYKLSSRNDGTFSNEFFYSVADNLSNRNLNYSLLDNIIFTSHARNHLNIIKTFPKSKIINITHTSPQEKNIINAMSELKNSSSIKRDENLAIEHKQILNIRFSDIFNEVQFEKLYSNIVAFLNLQYKLVRYDYIKFYISMQTPAIQLLMQEVNNENTI